jgi:hypothetical protein
MWLDVWEGLRWEIAPYSDNLLCCCRQAWPTDTTLNAMLCWCVTAAVGLKINAKLGGVNVRLAGNPDQVSDPVEL